MFEIPDELIEALKTAEHDQTVELFNHALRLMAACQQKLRVRGVRSTVQAGGDAIISFIADAQGTSSASYARVNWRTHEMTVIGTLPSIPGDDYKLQDPIAPKE